MGAYALGVLVGSRVAAPRRPAARPAVCLALETAVLVAFVALWLATRQTARPAPALLVPAGSAMGLQSVAVRAMGRPGLSTTYLTGTFTRLLGRVGEPAWPRRLDPAQVLALAGLGVGAAVEAVLMGHLPWVGPLLAALLTAGTLPAAYGQSRTAGR